MRLLVNNTEGTISECRDGVVVIALAFHLRGPSSGHEWVKLVVGYLLCSERFFSGFFQSAFSNFSLYDINLLNIHPESLRINTNALYFMIFGSLGNRTAGRFRTAE